MATTRATTKAPARKRASKVQAPPKSSAGKALAGSSSTKVAPPAEPAKPKAEVPPKPAAEQPKTAHKEAVSLIDPKSKGKTSARSAREAAEAKPVLPPISRLGTVGGDIRTEPEAPAPPPADAPAPEPEAAPADHEAEKVIHIKPPIIVKELATQLGLKSFQLIRDLMDMNIYASFNQALEPEVAAMICSKHGFVFEKEKREKGAGVHKVEQIIEAPPPPVIQKEEELKPRPPIVTFMGHVDHGKTSLLDLIRKTRVAAGEAGGITQHIGAYGVQRDGNSITFLDTPGHQAFTAMRARGANVTDIVVLVVAADDGVMPQTVEAISHAKAAKVPIIVALNKIDLPGANIDRVKAQLQERELTPEDWGGDTICCPVSAIKGTGVDHLLESILLVAEIAELRASPTALPRGTVIEAQLEPGRGPTATIIVGMGTLKIGQPFICGNHWGKVKSLLDDTGRPVKEAGPSAPVKVVGFSGLPNAGDEILVMESERAARLLSEERLEALRSQKLAAPQRATLENLFDALAENQRKVLQLVLKGDVQGSLEAIVQSLKQIDTKKIELDVIHAAVGPITESDILLATASNAVTVGFNVKVENSAANAAKREGVQIKLYSIIYELIDQIKEAMAGMLEPELRETVLGHAEVKQVFQLSKGIVAGCLVSDGRILRTGRARVLRKKQPIYDGAVATLRRFQDDVKEVRAGLECGIRLGDFNEYQVEDIIECYQLEKVPQKL
jgi:translation initiation factor IF-2